MKPFVVGIAGGSGSGKSTLAIGLQKTFPNAVLIFHLDDYFKPEADVPVRANMANWDHPQALYYTKMVHDLAALKAGKTVTVLTKSPALNPSFVKTGKRIPVDFVPQQIIIVEGFLVLHYTKIRKLLDMSVFLDAPFYVHSQRRVHGKLHNFPPDYDSAVLRPMHDRYVTPSRVHADTVLNVTQLNQTQVLATVAGLIAKRTT